MRISINEDWYQNKAFKLVGTDIEQQNSKAFAAGNEEIRRFVLDEMIPKLYAMFMQSWPNPSLVEELVQQTIFQAVRGGDFGEYEKVDLDTVKFTINLEPNSKKNFEYTLRTYRGVREENRAKSSRKN